MDDYISRSLFEMFPIGFGFFAKLGAHQTMLADNIRCEAYRLAINQAVKKGDVVLDIGAGTGILSIFAAQAGAKKIYAIESNPIVLKILKSVISQNNFRSIEVIEGESFDITLPEKVDVIVSETIGFWGVDENIVGIFADAKARFGHEHTVCIPENLELYLVPIEYETFYKEVTFWKQERFGIDLGVLDHLSKNNVYVRQVIEPDQFLCTPIRVISIIPHQLSFQNFKADMVFQADKPGVLHGFAGWFLAKLHSYSSISTSPLSKTLHWKHCVFPVEQAVILEVNDQVRLEVEAIVSRTNIKFSWNTRVFRADNLIADFSQSTNGF